MAAPKGHPPYNTNGEGGRPPEYSNEIIEEYANQLSQWSKNPDNIWLKDFCLERDINPDLISKFANKNERFAGVYELAKHRQESKIVNGAFKSTISCPFAKFALINHHGWAERSETKVTGIDKDDPNSTAYQLAEARKIKSEQVDE